MRQRIWRLLTSVRLALALIGLLAIASFYGITVDQRWFGRWPFLALSAAFFVNLAACTWLQVDRAWRRWRPVAIPRPETMALKATWAVAGPIDPAVLEKRMAGRRYQVRRVEGAGPASGAGPSGGVTLHGTRFRWSLWGPAVFHVGLVLVVTGGALSLFARTWGSFGVLEGNTFADHRGGYVAFNAGLLAPERHDQFRVRVDEVVLTFDAAGRLKDYGARTTLLRGDRVEAQAVVDGAHPLEWRGFTFYKNLFGYAPALHLGDEAGKEIGRFYALLDTSMPGVGADVELKPGRIHFAGTFTLPRTPYRVRAQFYPDASGPPERTVSRSQVPRDPAVVLEVSKSDQTVYTGRLRPGETARFGGLALRYDHTRRWYGFTVVHDVGVRWVFAGAWLATLALVGLYLLPPREVVVSLAPVIGGGTAVIAGGRAHRFPALFAAEFAALTSELREVAAL